MENSGKNKYFDQSMQFDAIASDDELLEARRLATYSVNALRVAKSVDRTFVLFPAAVQALTSLDRLFQLGTEFNMPQGMRLVGPSGVGKTASFEYFRASLPNSALLRKVWLLLVFGCRISQGHLTLSKPSSTRSATHLIRAQHGSCTCVDLSCSTLSRTTKRG